MGDCHFGDCNFDDEYDSPMSGFVFFCILGAALMHALWNILLKSASDKNLETAVANFATAILALPLLVIYGLPDPQTFPYIALSIALHLIYFYLVASAYRFGDLNLAYPIMRGAAPALAAIAALLFLGETTTTLGWLGVALISLGALSLAVAAWRISPMHAGGLVFALGNAGVIAAYTVVDGQGARLSGNALSYTGWTFVLTAILLLLTTRLMRGQQLWGALRPMWRTAVLGGAGTLGAYSMVLWAMGHAPIAAVAALRESSIVFAAIIG
ncbi:MAG: EamA family transporter, partial [Rhodobacteraceae bacterium]|nr:EamA family transporter [Paracoccaceae bacterium]